MFAIMLGVASIVAFAPGAGAQSQMQGKPQQTQPQSQSQAQPQATPNANPTLNMAGIIKDIAQLKKEVADLQKQNDELKKQQTNLLAAVVAEDKIVKNLATDLAAHKTTFASHGHKLGKFETELVHSTDCVADKVMGMKCRPVHALTGPVMNPFTGPPQ